VHDDKHDFPTLKHKEEAAPESAPEPAPEPEKAEAHVLMTDDEGTVADVSSSIAAAKVRASAMLPAHLLISLNMLLFMAPIGR
jgi:hypothetical protein